MEGIMEVETFLHEKATCPIEIGEEIIPSIIRVNCRKCGRIIATIDEGEFTDDLCYKCSQPDLYPAW